MFERGAREREREQQHESTATARARSHTHTPSRNAPPKISRQALGLENNTACVTDGEQESAILVVYEQEQQCGSGCVQERSAGWLAISAARRARVRARRQVVVDRDSRWWWWWIRGSVVDRGVGGAEVMEVVNRGA